MGYGSFTANPGAGGDNFARDSVVGLGNIPLSKIDIGAEGVSSPVTAANPLPMTVSGTATITGAVSVSNFPASQAVTGTFWQATQPISAASLPLPSNAAQETGGNLATLVARTPALGQAAMAASQPVVIASDQSAVPVIPSAAATQTYNVAGVITINTVLLTLDMSQYRGASIQCTSMGTTGVVTPEWSNDNATWVAATIFTPPGASATTFNAAGLWNVQKQARYLRLRLSTATTAGTTTIQTEAYQNPPQAWLATQPVSLATNTPTLAAGTNLAADVGVQYRATATGAASTFAAMSAATTAAAAVKAGAGRLVGFCLHNSSTGLRSVKMFNVAQASVTMGTTSATFEIDIPAGGIAQLHFEGGLSFGTAITWAVTSGKGLTDNTATGLAANDVSGFFAFA